jgi:hypothetical protein
MADFAQALKARLVAAIGGEIHWGIVPQAKSLPYDRLQVISDPRPQHLQGYDGARVSRVQADCFASSWGAARARAEAIISALAAPSTVNGIQFGRIKAEGPRDLGEDVEGIGYIHRASLDLLVEHTLA